MPSAKVQPKKKRQRKPKKPPTTEKVEVGQIIRIPRDKTNYVVLDASGYAGDAQASEGAVLDPPAWIVTVAEISAQLTCDPSKARQMTFSMCQAMIGEYIHQVEVVGQAVVEEAKVNIARPGKPVLRSNRVKVRNIVIKYP